MNLQTYLDTNEQETRNRATYYRRNPHKLAERPRRRPRPRPVRSGNILVQQTTALVWRDHEFNRRVLGAKVNHREAWKWMVKRKHNAWRWRA